ncbi:hypothetical protein RM843_004748 [Salmonella enterica]|nr:hypothetical protein [Salmonella enterica subsp. enterica serovar Everleigh]EDN7243323.1 hypothetical protein [Salmonella enterica subsp. enterica serovar Thompson]EDU0501871.1 hypothetical protein [Salmonella enterica subsp. salamae]EDU7995809.1 hypothetical protein [Salmonella enterica subsp. diarizonae]ELE9879937.1 hypothetical protein [Salmonella enterica]
MPRRGQPERAQRPGEEHNNPDFRQGSHPTSARCTGEEFRGLQVNANRGIAQAPVLWRQGYAAKAA